MKTAKEFRAQARKALQGRYWWAFLASLIATALGGIAGSGGSTAGGSAANNASNTAQMQMQMSPEEAKAMLAVVGVVVTIGIIVSIVWLIVGSAVELGYNEFNVVLYQSDEKPAMGTLFGRFDIFGKALWLRILTGLKVFLWSLLLVVPGIIAAYRYAMAPYLLAEHPEMTVNEAIEGSKTIMAGNKWRLFCLQLSFIGWYLLGLLALGVGVLFVTPYSQAADAAFYLELTKKPEEAEVTAEAVPAQI